MTAEDELHASRIITCLVRRLGGQVVITAEDLRDEPAALSVVAKLDGFEIKVLERGQPGPDLIDMGYLARPVVSTDPMDPGGTWHGHNAPEPPPDWVPLSVRERAPEAAAAWQAGVPLAQVRDHFSALDLGYVERSPTMLGGSLNPSPDCGGPRKPPGATELWWCDSHTQFHGPTDPSTTGGDQ